VLALLPVLIVAASLPGRALMRCRFDGTLRDACCCPGDDEASGPSAPFVAEARCCERVMADASRTPVVSSRSAEPGVDGASSVILPVAVAPAAPEPPRAPPGLARGCSLPPRPPLLVLKQTFLI